MENLLNKFRPNKFDPLSPKPHLLPNKPGNYLFCLKGNSKLPDILIVPIVSKFENLRVIYTGITGKSLQGRDSKQHFNGNAEGSTVRSSVGALLGFKNTFRITKKGKTKKTKYKIDQEVQISDWMKGNLIMYYIESEDYTENEDKLINHFNPPLNLRGNRNIENRDYRKLLSELRNRK